MRDRERNAGRRGLVGRKDKGDRGERERRGEEEGDVSIAFHSKEHGGQEVGMQHRSTMDSSLKVY